MTRTAVLLAPMLAAALVAATPTTSLPQSRERIISSLDMAVPFPPTPVTVAGTRHLAYELHLTNFRPSEITVTRVEVLDAKGASLGDFQEAKLDTLLKTSVIAPGMRTVVYFWLPLERSTATLTQLRHRVSLEFARPLHQTLVIEGGVTDVRTQKPIVLSPPLRGGPWVALYDPLLAGGHRSSIYAVDGRARIPARFAIDWVRLERDGSRARGDATSIANWYGYGVDVLAVADAVVASAMDDIAEDPSLTSPAHAPIPLENVSGNFICLSLGDGRYAFYEHLKHDSIRVKAGDHVKAGQVIAQLGNSGGSSAGPHLHFHVADTQAELGGEGLPYVFNRFEVVGAFEAIDAFAAGQRWSTSRDGSGRRNNELPAPNTVVVFEANKTGM